MARDGDQFAGVTVAMVTPFRDDLSVDYDALDKLVDWHVSKGTDALAPMGTTGESPTVDHDEHRRIVDAVVKRAAGRIKVMAGTGSNSTAEAVMLTKSAKESGADAALVVGPYYNKPTQEGYKRHFETIADEGGLPVVIYNIPGRTGSNIAPETIADLGRHERIIAVKEATGSMDQATQILKESNLTVLSGDDSLTLPLMAIGGGGVVSVLGNILPDRLLNLVRLAASGDFKGAAAEHLALFGLAKNLLGLASNPIPLKAAMKLLGRGNGVLRLPMTPLGPDQEETLRQTLKQHGML